MYSCHEMGISDCCVFSGYKGKKPEAIIISRKILLWMTLRLHSPTNHPLHSSSPLLLALPT